MKKLAILMVCWWLGTPAIGAQTEVSSLRSQMAQFEIKKKVYDEELADVKTQMFIVSSKSGSNFSKMNDQDLITYIQNEKKYLLITEAINEDLNQIYIPGYVTKKKPFVDYEINIALKNLAKKCNLMKRITSVCLTKREALVYQVEYLKQKIEGLETLDTALLYEINSLIVQKDTEKGLMPATD